MAAANVVEAVRVRLGHIPPPQITFKYAVVQPEAIALPATPTEPINRIRAELRAAIADVLGASNVEGDPSNFRPHVSIAYNTNERPARPVIDILDAVAPPTATFTIPKISLIRLDRDDGFYHWDTDATARLGGSSLPLWN